MTAKQRAQEAESRIAGAEGAARLLAALIPALDVAEQSDYIGGHIRENLNNRVAGLLSLVESCALRFEEAS